MREVLNRRWLGAGLLVLACALELGSESVSLTTYYPAPSGVYAQMITTSDTWLARDGGNVGIGTTSPQWPLDVPTGNIKANAYYLNPGGVSYISASANTTGGDGIGFFNSDSEKVTITAGGTVSLGNTNPYEKNFRLEVGAIDVVAGTGRTGQVGAIWVHQTGCAVKEFSNAFHLCSDAAIVSGSCESDANCYVTGQAGIMSEYSIPAGSINANKGYMLCCPCGGLCPNSIP